MKTSFAIIYFWSLTFSFQVYAGNSKEDLGELNDSISGGINNIYVGPKVDNRKTTSCFDYFISLIKKVGKCPSEDTKRFLNEYLNDENAFISKGVDGEVRKFVRSSDGKQLAVKKLLKKDPAAYCDYLKEVEMLEKFKNEEITAKIYCTFKDNEGYFYYMMGFLQGQTLEEANFYNPKKENFNVKWADLCLNMATIIQTVNIMGIVHLDAHLRNWIVTPEGQLYLIDFSRSQWLDGNQPQEVAALGIVFRDVQNKMLLILGKYLKLGWDSMAGLREQVGQYADIEGIGQIIKSMLVVEGTPKIKSIISALETFKEKYDGK